MIDAQLNFSRNETIRGAQALGNASRSDNEVDIGGIENLGTGSTLYVLVAVTTEFAGGTNVTFSLHSSDTAGITPSAANRIASFNGGNAVTTANLKEGSRFIISVDPTTANRYLRMSYVSTGTFTAGAITAVLTDNIEVAEAYQEAVGARASGMAIDTGN